MNDQPRTPLTLEQKDDVNEHVYDILSEAFFERVNFLTYPTTLVSSNTTDTVNYDILYRVGDTTSGEFLMPNRVSRVRMSLYVNGGVENADMYVLSPARYDAASVAGVDLTTLDFLHSYVGLRVNAGDVSLVSKTSSGYNEVSTSKTLVGDTTYVVEIIYNVSSATIIINNEELGSVTADMSTDLNNVVTMYPLMIPIRSTTGTAVKATTDNYQFMQDR